MSEVINSYGIPLPPTAQTASTVLSNPQFNPVYKGAAFIFNVTNFNSGQYTPSILGYDYASQNWYTILQGSAITGTGTTVLEIYPGITATANVSASALLPYQWVVQLVGASNPSMTISVGVNYGM